MMSSFFSNLRFSFRDAIGNFLSVLAVVGMIVFPFSANAQGRGGQQLPVIRDAEIEELLRDYAKPLLRVAGLERQNIQVVIINKPEFNAFVADGRRIFINAGALTQAETPNEIIGVLAHEIAHLAGGHLARLRQEMQAAQTAAVIAMLLGAGVAAAASSTGATGDQMQGIAAGTFGAPQDIIRRSMTAASRTEERAADRAALTYLTKTGQSAKGMLTIFSRFAQESMFLSRRIDPYLITHPMPADRLAFLEEGAKASPHFNRKDPPALQQRHDLMRAKINAFSGRGGTVERIYGNNNSLPAKYARAISTFRFGNLNLAVRYVDDLIKAQPRNPYFQELKGQILLESARPREAIAPLRRAVSISGNDPLISLKLGKAMVATGDDAIIREASGVLSAALRRETDMSEGWEQLAFAYARQGKNGQATLASANAAFTRGDFNTASHLAERAQQNLPKGSPGWLQANDILKFEPPKQRGR